MSNKYFQEVEEYLNNLSDEDFVDLVESSMPDINKCEYENRCLCIGCKSNCIGYDCNACKLLKEKDPVFDCKDHE